MKTLTVARQPRRRAATAAALVFVLALGAGGGPVAPAAATDDGEGVALLRAEIDGFGYWDASRDSVLHADGWCPTGERLMTLVCAEDLSAGSAQLHAGLLGFEAWRRVTPPVPSPADATLSRRLLYVEVLPTRPGELTVTVDATPAGGASFRLHPATAVPPPDSADAEVVSWQMPTAGSSEDTEWLVFAVSYDTDLGASGAADAIPAVTVRLDHGDGAVAAEHLRGQVESPAGLTVRRISELAYQARVAPATAPPRLEAGAFTPQQQAGYLGMRMSTHQDIAALGAAPPLTFDDQAVRAWFRDSGRYFKGLSTSTRLGGVSGSVFAGFEVERQEIGQPPFFNLAARLRFAGGEVPGLADGDAARATYHAQVEFDPSFRIPEGAEPRNDEGRLVYVWDGVISDEVGFVDRYGDAARPGNLETYEGEQPHVWLHSMWNVESRVVGGDIDRRTPPPPDDLVDAALGTTPADGTLELEVPDGWVATRVVTLGGPHVDVSSRTTFNPDGSVTYGWRVRDGEFWLEAQPGPDGKHTWSWPSTILVDSFRGERVDSIQEPLLERIDTHWVGPGEELPIRSVTRNGVHDELLLGPGLHTIRHNQDGTMTVVNNTLSSAVRYR